MTNVLFENLLKKVKPLNGSFLLRENNRWSFAKMHGGINRIGYGKTPTEALKAYLNLA